MPLLVRDFFTWETLFKLLRETALQPLLTGPLLYASIRDALLPSSLSFSRKTQILKILRVLFTLGTLRVANNTLSKLVLNNWTIDTWRKNEEVVLITGGGSGIGELMARDLAPYSKAIIVLDLIPSKMSMPSNVFFYKTDITSLTAISTTATRIRTTHGEPSILINNAGIGCPFPLLSSPLTEAQIHQTFNVNLISHFFIIKEFLPAMVRENHGHVVTIASLASYLSITPTVAYSCSKAGTVAFHEGLANELVVSYEARRVRTTIVHPSFIRTPLVTRMLANPRFKGYVLEPQTVVDAIVENLLKSRSGQINIPGRVGFWSYLRAFPVWLQVGLRNREAWGFKRIQEPQK